MSLRYIGLGVAFLSTFAYAQHFPLPGEWPCAGRNAGLDARSPLRGNITTPEVAWKVFVGNREAFATLKQGAGARASTPTDSLGTPPDFAASNEWNLQKPEGLIAGGQQTIPRDLFVTYADVLPEHDGLEKIEVRRAGTVACFAWNNVWSQVWETPKQDFGDAVQMLPIAGDFDGDGKIEIAFLPWWQLVILDGATGAVKDACRFTEGRSYGYFGAHDLDGDGRSEFVVEADFAKHVDVIGFREGKLTVLWQRPIELDISNPQTVLRVNPDCVGDVNGDGKQEVLVNSYNDRVKGKWLLSVHDGMSGAIVSEFEDRYLSGVADVNGDGANDLLLTVTHGAGVPDSGPIVVVSLAHGAPETLWQSDQYGWSTWDKPLPLNINSGATFSARTALTRHTDGGFTAVLRAQHSESVAVTVARWVGGAFDAASTAEARALEPIALGADGSVLLKSMAPTLGDVSITANRGDIGYLGIRSAASSLAPVIVATGKSHPYLFATGSGEEIVALAGKAGEAPAVAYRMRERGQSTDWPNSQGPVVADLRGDGARQLICATQAPTGCARLVVHAAETGAEVWHHDFAEIPGTPPVWNTGGIILWRVGHFTSPTSQDVLVTVRRSMMHSDETALLSGVDGAELWRRQRQETKMHSRGVGGVPFALADFNGDGLDDAASLYPSQFYVLNGRTGENILLRDAAWEAVPHKPVYFGIAVAGEFDGKPGPEVMMAGSQMTGLMGGDGGLRWFDALGTSPNHFAFGDFDGNGQMEAIGFGFSDGIRCYAMENGLVRWQMTCPYSNAPTGVATADINSDGADEAIVSTGTTLMCIGYDKDLGSGKVLWKWPMPAWLGPPVVADVDGSGAASIVVAGQVGFVYCIKQKGPVISPSGI